MYPSRVTDLFHQRHGHAPAFVVRAPGRINLIGEHTDYNEGWVLPAAIDRALWLAVGPRADAVADLYAADFEQAFQAELGAIIRNDDPDWPNYLLGVVRELQRAGHTLPGGFNIVFGGDIPAGAGLSSSAALESGTLFALDRLHNLGLSRIDMARMAQRSEHEFVGVRVGIMDMFVVLHGQKGSALKLDCRSLEYTLVQLPADDAYRLVLCDSQVKHSLVSSEYNARRAECEAGVAKLQLVYPNIRALRDVTPSMLREHSHLLAPLTLQRCRYVVEENDRLQQATAALAAGDWARFGALLVETHAGLRDDYQVSVPELDLLVDSALNHPRCLGARLMGGGFGGCTINLVATDQLESFAEHQKNAYRQAYGKDLPVWPVQLMDGVSLADGSA